MSLHFRLTLPALAVGVPLAAATAALLREPQEADLAVLFGIVALAGCGYYRWFMRGVLDEVYDDGERLLVRHRGVEDTVALREVTGVKAQRLRTLVRLTLTLAVPGKFGDKIVFLLRDTFLDGLPYGPPALIKNLEDRVAKLKQESMRQP